jgi:hypothetical protein
MEIVTVISIMTAVALGILLWNRQTAIRKLQEDLKWQRDANMQLLKQEPAKNEEHACMEPLNVEKIAEAIRTEGFIPETEGNWVSFKVQGEGYYVDANRLPLIFVIKGYGVDPNEWEMDLLREAAHQMSDELVMVKATFSDDGKDMRFFIAARDRNYESFRANLTSYLGILEDGQRVMNEKYHKMVDEKREAALAAKPYAPQVKQENKVLS